jgi:methionine-rich copper-binding protein CopC
MRFAVFIALVAPLLIVGSGVAAAHAFLDRADPKVGSVVYQAPHEVALTFTQKLEGSFSSLEVTDAAGRRVDEGTPSVRGNVMRVPVKTLSPGVYRVKWQVLSVDAHRTEGGFTFEVRPY